MTYDGLYKYTYDAWNRMIAVQRAWRTTAGVQTGSKTASISYDGLNRRIVKKIDHSGTWDCTYHYYYDGQRIVEERNGSSQVLEQYVWGQQYVDELVQIGVNQNPGNAATENLCERFFWVCQDANFNVLGVVSSMGSLVERYEYTPYGQHLPCQAEKP